MPKIPHSHYLVCAMHPEDVDGEVCPDVKLPVTYETNHVQRLTRSQQYQILMTHPMFTGMCPLCRYEYKGWNQNSWDCPDCGWKV